MLALVKVLVVHQNTWNYGYPKHKCEGERVWDRKLDRTWWTRRITLGSHSEKRSFDNLSISCWPLALRSTITFQHHHTEAQESKIWTIEAQGLSFGLFAWRNCFSGEQDGSLGKFSIKPCNPSLKPRTHVMGRVVLWPPHTRAPWHEHVPTHRSVWRKRRRGRNQGEAGWRRRRKKEEEAEGGRSCKCS